MQFSQDWKTKQWINDQARLFLTLTPNAKQPSYLRQDKIAKPTDTVHIVSMNITSCEVRIVNLDCVKSSATKTTDHDYQSYIEINNYVNAGI